MTFPELWANLESKKPRLKDPAATLAMTSAALQRLLKQVYDEGAKDVRRTNKGGKFSDLFPWMKG